VYNKWHSTHCFSHVEFTLSSSTPQVRQPKFNAVQSECARRRALGEPTTTTSTGGGSYDSHLYNKIDERLLVHNWWAHSIKDTTDETNHTRIEHPKCAFCHRTSEMASYRQGNFGYRINWTMLATYLMRTNWLRSLRQIVWTSCVSRHIAREIQRCWLRNTSCRDRVYKTPVIRCVDSRRRQIVDPFD